MDGHSGVRGLTNSSGSLTDSYAYGAFGDLKNSTGTTANNYRYTGQQFDNQTGLYSLRARYYNPSEGRFLSRDTWQIDQNNPIELNRYGYTANNSVNATDPSGLLAEYGLIRVLLVATSVTWTILLVAPLLLHLNVTYTLGASPRTCDSNQVCTYYLDHDTTVSFGKLLRDYARFYRELSNLLTATVLGVLLSFLGLLGPLGTPTSIVGGIIGLAGLALLGQNPASLDKLAAEVEKIAKGSNNKNDGRAKVTVKGIKDYNVGKH
jgi:RHS repeat-associated protein